MSLERRIELIRRIEELRGSKVICYLTSLRPNVVGQMAEDAVRVFFEHLLLLPSRPAEKLDIFLCSNGGSGTVPWRLTALLREFSQSFSVLIPYRAYSAATLLALGADEIIMHPFGEMGPIDPTVSNDFNPVETSTGRRLGISVEDVKAYVSFIKETVGITHEDELVKTIEILANRIHPLAIGNVERFLLQSRLTARKILKTHMEERGEHEIEEIIENMASKLYFHGHPINRLEARKELKLKVNTDVTPELETVMWDLYKNYERDFRNTDEYRPIDDLMLKAFPPGQGKDQGPAQQKIQDALLSETTEDLLLATVESASLSTRCESKRRYVLCGMDQAGQPSVRVDTISVGWVHSRVGSTTSDAGPSAP